HVSDRGVLGLPVPGGDRQRCDFCQYIPRLHGKDVLLACAVTRCDPRLTAWGQRDARIGLLRCTASEHEYAIQRAHHKPIWKVTPHFIICRDISPDEATSIVSVRRMPCGEAPPSRSRIVSPRGEAVFARRDIAYPTRNGAALSARCVDVAPSDAGGIPRGPI